MRVHCPRCESVATIQTTEPQSPEYKKLYCTCNNPACAMGFVMDLQFSHTTSPSALDLPAGFIEKLTRANISQQKNLFTDLAPA